MEWTIFYGLATCSMIALTVVVWNAILSSRPKQSPEVVTDVQPLDLAPTVELLLDVANYLTADASKGGRSYQLKCEIEAKRLGGK